MKKPSRETNPFFIVKPKINIEKYIKWVNPNTPINHGKLGSSRIIKKKNKQFYD